MADEIMYEAVWIYLYLYCYILCFNAEASFLVALLKKTNKQTNKHQQLYSDFDQMRDLRKYRFSNSDFSSCIFNSLYHITNRKIKKITPIIVKMLIIGSNIR